MKKNYTVCLIIKVNFRFTLKSFIPNHYIKLSNLLEFHEFIARVALYLNQIITYVIIYILPHLRMLLGY